MGSKDKEIVEQYLDVVHDYQHYVSIKDSERAKAIWPLVEQLYELLPPRTDYIVNGSPLAEPIAVSEEDV